MSEPSGRSTGTFSCDGTVAGDVPTSGDRHTACLRRARGTLCDAGWQLDLPAPPAPRGGGR